MESLFFYIVSEHSNITRTKSQKHLFLWSEVEIREVCLMCSPVSQECPVAQVGLALLEVPEPGRDRDVIQLDHNEGVVC